MDGGKVNLTDAAACSIPSPVTAIKQMLSDTLDARTQTVRTHPHLQSPNFLDPAQKSWCDPPARYKIRILASSALMILLLMTYNALGRIFPLLRLEKGRKGTKTGENARSGILVCTCICHTAALPNFPTFRGEGICRAFYLCKQESLVILLHFMAK